MEIHRTRLSCLLNPPPKEFESSPGRQFHRVGTDATDHRYLLKTPALFTSYYLPDNLNPLLNVVTSLMVPICIYLLFISVVRINNR
ncbi:hypothetical protein Lfee_1493 [Legionella feeleii]|uniref:Uncharacterized protein n=1 Tax=Legionella feeleii TaxID=453 RepID=A0A0W0TSX8_9GAMM|nr:hypothetical protein Lfee_1493 [Legionella feeleii]SPX62792.1 Uncharacterised protein [Legionella feeleii]